MDKIGQTIVSITFFNHSETHMFNLQISSIMEDLENLKVLSKRMHQVFLFF